MAEQIAYTITQAAQLVGVSRPTMYKWINKAGFPVVRLDGCVRIPAKAFERWLEQQAEE